MTAYAVGATPAAVPVPCSTPAAGAQNAATPGHFENQLDAARQCAAPHDPEPRPTEPNARDSASKPNTLNCHRTDPSRTTDPRDPSKTALAKTSATTPADVPTPAALSGMPVAGVADAGAAGAKAPAAAAKVDDHAASALAGAMLALIGPAVAGALRPAAAVGAADALGRQAGKIVATDAQAGMLSLGDATGAAAAAASPSPGMLTIAKDLLPVSTTAKDSSTADAAPSMAMSALPTPVTAPALPVLHLQSPVGSQGFAQELGQQVAWLGGQDIKQARIRLHPAELGSLDVQVSLSHGRVDVVFSAQHPGAVAAVQQSLPQLDHMLTQHGLSLGHAEVGQHDRGDRHGQSANAGSATLEEPGEIHAIGTTAPGQIGLLDAFA